MAGKDPILTILLPKWQTASPVGMPVLPKWQTARPRLLRRPAAAGVSVSESGKPEAGGVHVSGAGRPPAEQTTSG